MSRIKSHYVAQIVLDCDIDLSEPGLLDKEVIKQNMKEYTTSNIKRTLLDYGIDEFGKLEITEMMNDVIEVEE